MGGTLNPRVGVSTPPDQMRLGPFVQEAMNTPASTLNSRASHRGERIRVTGLVQGVGFRPTVWRLARSIGLTGAVWNDAGGAVIEVWGMAADLDRFSRMLVAEAPPLARIDSIERQALPVALVPGSFEIADSESGVVRTGVAADAATCRRCLADVFDPDNRRFRYPFTNCTHCGPRLSIVRAIPYDRANTSMAKFRQCEACLREYQDPANRRFHAQPNACSRCGPAIWLENDTGAIVKPDPGTDAIEVTARLIRSGAIVAIKGIGGFHLACDAANSDAVLTLRQRKRRSDKPFALMGRDSRMIYRYARLDGNSLEVLQSPAAPVVLLERHGGKLLAPEVAPGQAELGFMLPYAPLHHLLMASLARPIVLTSGNRSEEPQCIDNDDARRRLRGITDYWLMHDRDIVNRVDDSVVRILDGKPRLLRRARGLAPEPVTLAEPFKDAPAVLGMGAQLKNTFCLLRQGSAILSQHMGDLEDAATHDDYRGNLGLYRRLYDFQPRLVAIDQHPDYLSTRWGTRLAEEEGLTTEGVQHHHAHIAACLAECGLPPDARAVLGIVLDGLGFGGDGTLWGGEFLLADYRDYRRVAAFAAVPMPGGARAVYEPWRNTIAHLFSALGWARSEAELGREGALRFLGEKPFADLKTIITRGLNSPDASSAGRLFDAVAAALGVCHDKVSFEGQAAMALEGLAMMNASVDQGAYPFVLERSNELWRLTWAPLWHALLSDIRRGVDKAAVAARFHAGLAVAISRTAVQLGQVHRFDTVVLSGGVFQNKLLLEGVCQRLRHSGLKVLSPCLTPSNDGGISLGQAAVAAARHLLRGKDGDVTN